LLAYLAEAELIQGEAASGVPGRGAPIREETGEEKAAGLRSEHGGGGGSVKVGSSADIFSSPAPPPLVLGHQPRNCEAKTASFSIIIDLINSI